MNLPKKIIKVFVAACLCLEVVAYEQNDYNMTSERMEVVSYNRNWVAEAKTHNFKYNRTIAVTNITIDLKRDIGNDLDFVITSYRFASNEYRLFPMAFKVNACDALAKNEFGVKKLLQCGNFNGCPMLKRRYVICNWVVDGSLFPPYIPSGNYMSDVKAFHLSTEIGHYQWYYKVEKRFWFN